MATEREANLARQQNSDMLRNLGAHAIAVDEVQRQGKATFAVVAFFEGKRRGVPRTLEVTHGDQTLAVPLVARVAERFEPE